MRENIKRNPGKSALIILFAVVAVLVLVNGIVLLCESDPAQFYSTLFGLK